MKVIYTLSLRDALVPLKVIIMTHNNKMAQDTQRLPHMHTEND